MPQARRRLRQIYRLLFDYFGPQHWWPARTPFEVMMGAILVQNTNWTNAECAISNLKARRWLSPEKLRCVSHRGLARAIRPAGYFNVKAKRLKNFIDFLFREYGGCLSLMAKETAPALRAKLLSVNGIGPETADSILLYALDRPYFVVDAYTKRVLSRHKMIAPDADYQVVQDLFTLNLSRNVRLFNEYHALLVRLAKDYCRTRPLCQDCPLNLIKKEEER